MREIIVSTMQPDIAELKDEKRQLRTAIEKARANQNAELLTNLLLECADKCGALGHRFRQKGYEERAKGYEKRAKYEFYEANQYQQEAAQICHNIR